MRIKMLTLLATAMAVVGVGVLPSLASAATPEGGAGIQSLPSGLEARVKSDCPASYVCFWSGKTFGTAECESGQNCYSQFHGYEVGKHNLENINPQSMYNHTGEHLAWFLGPLWTPFAISPGGTYQWGSPYTSYFEIS
jgi:hypothetical protein